MTIEIFRKILLMTPPLTFVVVANGHDVPSLGALEDDLCIETFYLRIRVSQEQQSWMDVRFKWRFPNLPATFPEIHNRNTNSNITIPGNSPVQAAQEGVLVNINFTFEASVSQLSRPTSCSFEFYNEHTESPAARTCLTLLKAAPNLRFFVYHAEFDDISGTTLERSARQHGGSALDHDLESLQLIVVNNYAAIVARIRLPSLKRLVYEDGSRTAPQTIFDLILRSNPLLTYLKLRSESVDKIMTVNVLRLLPMLEELHLSDFALSAQSLRALNMKNEGSTPRREDKPVIRPKLQLLRLQQVVPQELETCTDVLFSLIQSRPAHRPFQNVHLSRTFGVIALSLTESDHDRMGQELQSRGSIFLRGNDS
ncbi:hypothetical protein ACEPAF_8161 [Sanghuangporus sanghuang]